MSGDAPGVQTSITELAFTLHLCQCSEIFLLESTLSFYNFIFIKVQQQHMELAKTLDIATVNCPSCKMHVEE